MNSMRFVALAILALFSLSEKAQSYTEYTGDIGTAAYVQGTFSKPCLSLAESFETKLEDYVRHVPFVKAVKKINSKDWAMTTKNTDSVDYSKKVFLSTETSLRKEFPLTIFTMDAVKKVCESGKAGESCKQSATFDLVGKKAISYQKAISSSSKQNVWSSFSSNFSFTQGASADQCIFKIQFNTLDSSYLWTKKHLFGGTPPAVIEKAMQTAFVSWGKKVFAQLETSK